MNEEVILSMVAPYVKDRAITYDEFDKLFSILSLREQYAVTDILFINGINLVDNHVDEDTIVFDVDNENASVEDFEDDFEVLYDDAIFKDKGISDTNSKRLVVHKTIRQSNEILCHLIQQGNAQAAQDLCIKNKSLVDKYATAYEKRYDNRLDFEDLEQVGFLGLIKAAQRFNIQQDVSFSTYAVYWIKQSIAREIMDNGYLVRIPVHMMERINKVMSVNNRILESDVSLDDRIRRISEELDLTEENVRECIFLKNNYLSYTSLETPIGDESDSVLGDFIPDKEEISIEQIVFKKELRKELESVLQHLNPKEQEVIKLRYGWDDGKPRTLEEIAGIFNRSRERIRQIEKRAERKLRHPKRSCHLKIFMEE
ncbi:MAG: sigma-70 family RNA polymerase sigma factor [Oscillospiraceae bacterium]|nr:sigma-70 family RNA polymerase sigma factor [Oscillospiraceae bacterium]